MGIVVKILYIALMAVLGHNSVATLLAIAAGACIYGVLVIKTHTIRREELMGLSMGRKIVKVCDKLRLW